MPYASPPTLTTRQREVVELLFRGMTTPQIAAELGISVGTVKIHLRAAALALGRSPDVGPSSHWWVQAAFSYGYVLGRTTRT